MNKKKKEKPQMNYLDLIPVKSEELQWNMDIKQRVILKIENKGLFNTIAQKIFGKPRFTKVHLDANGSFIWPLIDGERSVMELALLVKEEYGDKAEPLYPRIIKYFQMLESYHFIRFKNMPKK